MNYILPLKFVEKYVEDVKRQKEREKLARAAKRKLEATDESDEECTQINHKQDDDAEEFACLYCNELYSWSKSKELWLKCQLCSLWAHAACADKSEKTKHFICLCEDD
ncbi:unnamed protein product [Phaedon cochleariae]|uniref:Zinc finger PHD-type domain-containing protein n=1 Tax=Phaedon cochleariae TaxID=80249 RepID=A0A9N9SB10_PHACE|nr:unnamed protein product [Phaedon cochleariae]